ncbi:MAG: DnaD domain protein [Lachnospiraceae bacterium]|nr:DnaD domain protein [Lachnospiraceae bacterium]
MAKIKLHSSGYLATTCVPNIFIDKYMTNANGEFVKIYLYLLRKMQINDTDTAFSVSTLADIFDHTEKDILRALSYWEKVEMLHLEYDHEQNLTGIALRLPSDSVFTEDTSIIDSSVSVNTDTQPLLEPQADVSVTPEVSGKDVYTAEQVDNFQDNEAVQEVLFITENYLRRTLNSTDIRTILYWYDGLKFSPDLIEYLIETCISNGHTSLRYMEKIALSWAEAGISTVAEARKEHSMHNQDVYAVMKAFGISGRNLIQNEIHTIQKWTSSYAFSMDIIKEACRRTIQATGKASFEYADTILTNWHKNGVHTLADVQKLDAAHQKARSAAKSKATASQAAGNRFNNFSQRTYNYDQLEKQLLGTGN